MALDLHTVSVNDSSTPLSRQDRFGVALVVQLANGVGGGAGAAVAIPVLMALPASYAVQATPNQDATVWISARAQTGFTVNIAPRLAATTLAAGAIDVLVTY